jgi:RNA polymerase sigma-70 factor, ECF subfamily
MDPEAAFARFYEATYADLLRFVQRRARRDHAEDVVAEAFTVVWRRFADAPHDPGDRRAWTFGIARGVLLNAERGAQRRAALGVRLAEAEPVGPDASELAAARVDVARAWVLLSEVHQEALALSVLDDLPAPQAAAVLDISPVAFRLRLSRARRALRALLTTAPERTTCDVS